MLRKLIEEKEGISIKKVEKATGTPSGTLYKALGQGGNPESRTIEKILDYLGYEIRLVKSRKRPGSNLEKRRTRGDEKKA